MTPAPSLMSLVWLAAVVASIPLALWWLRRSGLLSRMPARVAAGPRVVSQTVIAPQQRLVTVEVGEGTARCWLVLGVTAQQMTVLHRMDPPPVEIDDGR
ncbi:MAG: flagellar biosynthetic protein FliO [Pseudomonadota bacterium]|jgi:flagellar protein FliO/FliZ